MFYSGADAGHHEDEAEGVRRRGLCHHRWRRSGGRHWQVPPVYRDTFVRIRIRGSVPLIYGSGIGSGSRFFVDSVIIVDCVPVVGTDRFTISLVDPWHFSRYGSRSAAPYHWITDPESISDPDFSSVADKMPTKNNFFFQSFFAYYIYISFHR